MLYTSEYELENEFIVPWNSEPATDLGSNVCRREN